LLQRSLRKARNFGRQALHSVGVKNQVPHSWHDYQEYWLGSALLQELRRQHASNLLEFEGSVFVSNPESLMERKDLPWRTGYRLLQLAIWLSIFRQYELPVILERP
jgi:hypothetical protein